MKPGEASKNSSPQLGIAFNIAETGKGFDIRDQRERGENIDRKKNESPGSPYSYGVLTFLTSPLLSTEWLKHVANASIDMLVLSRMVDVGGGDCRHQAGTPVPCMTSVSEYGLNMI